jgi:hypothetical protein
MPDCLLAVGKFDAITPQRAIQQAFFKYKKTLKNCQLVAEEIAPDAGLKTTTANSDQASHV